MRRPRSNGEPRLPVRLIILGAGAVGGVLGAKLHQAGEDVVLIARGGHLERMQSHGLELEEPAGRMLVPVRAVARPSDLDWRERDVVLLCTKTQDTAAALAELSANAPASTPVVCVQNGVENERLALRTFPNVYGCVVVVPAVHLEPGKVTCYATGPFGILDLGRYPSGSDECAREIAATLSGAGFSSRAVEDVMPSKYAKLLLNLGNAAEAICGRQDGVATLTARAISEGREVLEAAGIWVADDPGDATRRVNELGMAEIEGRAYLGSSTWQSLKRGAGTVEVDYLNGEILLLARLHGRSAPVNEALARIGNELARRREAPSHLDPGSVLHDLAGVGR
jgi:2-dehydropantoate 2-reductase